jgi:hypothetical protein
MNLGDMFAYPLYDLLWNIWTLYPDNQIKSPNTISKYQQYGGQYGTNVKKTSLKLKQVRAVEKDISNCIMNNAETYLNTHHSKKGNGIWYSDEYYKFLRKKGISSQDINQGILLDGYDGYADPEFFDKVGIFSFQIKKGKKPSDALMAFLGGLTLADCGTATLAVYYKTILDIIGKTKFDDLFRDNFTIISTISHPLDQLLIVGDSIVESNGIIGNRPLKIGDHLHFGGIKWYTNKHPSGFGAGWNIIYMGDNKNGEQLFMGLGFDKPLTEREINDKFIHCYNLQRTAKDLEYIKKYNDPILYDKNMNEWLLKYYTIKKEDVEKNPTKFLVGFLPFTKVSIRSGKLTELKYANSIKEFLN